MKPINWKKNSVVKKIFALQKDYVFRFSYAGVFLGTNVWNMSECNCCGNLASNLESLYHRDVNSNSTIHICITCSELWKAVDRYKYDWKPYLLNNHTEEELIEFLKNNPKPNNYEGSDYQWTSEQIKLK